MGAYIKIPINNDQDSADCGHDAPESPKIRVYQFIKGKKTLVLAYEPDQEPDEDVLRKAGVYDKNIFVVIDMSEIPYKGPTVEEWLATREAQQRIPAGRCNVTSSGEEDCTNCRNSQSCDYLDSGARTRVAVEKYKMRRWREERGNK